MVLKDGNGAGTLLEYPGNMNRYGPFPFASGLEPPLLSWQAACVKVGYLCPIKSEQRTSILSA